MVLGVDRFDVEKIEIDQRSYGIENFRLGIATCLDRGMKSFLFTSVEQGQCRFRAARAVLRRRG